MTRPLRHRIALACACLAAGFAAPAAHGQGHTNLTWIGTNSSDWTSPLNWQSMNVGPTGGTFGVRLNVNNVAANPVVYDAALGHTIYDPTNTTLGRALVIGNGTRGAMTITGGTFEARGAAADLIANGGGVSSLTIDGGNYIYTNLNYLGTGARTLAVNHGQNGPNSTGILNIVSGTVAVSNLQYGSIVNAQGKGIVNLSGGTLMANVIRTPGTVSNFSEFNFNGGTLMALGNNSSFMQGLSQASVSTNGAIIDTGGFSINIYQQLLHDANMATADGGLRKRSAGTLTLSNANTYSGQTTLETGVLQIRHGESLGTAAGGTVVSNGARLVLLNSVTVTGETIVINGTGGNNQGALQADGGTGTWDGPVVLASGTFNTGTRVGASGGGTLRLSGPITTNGGNWDLAIRNESPLGATVISGSGNAWRDTYAVVGTTRIDGGDDRLPVGTVLHIGNAANVSSAAFDLNGFNQRVAGLVSDGAGLDMVVTNSQAGLSILTINNSVTREFGCLTNHAWIGGNLSIVKTGSGLQNLYNNSTYTGETIVSNGTLAVNGTHTGGGLYTVHDSATLRGTGFIDAAIHSLTNSIIAPGNSIGTLTFDADAELDGILQIELDGSGLGFNDVLVVNGQLDISQTILDFNVLAALDDPAYVFATYGSLVTNLNGFFSVVDLPSGYDIVYNYGGGNNIALVIPEPSAFALSALGILLGAALLRRRR